MHHDRSPKSSLKPREDRRDRTWRAAARQHRLSVAASPAGVASVASPHFFAKRAALGCDCRRRRHGNPKVDRGFCKTDRRDVVAARREGRRACRAWLRGG